MKKGLLSGFCYFLIFSTYLSSQDCLVIDSSKANYDGKDIVLSGEVMVEHEIGKMSADHMVLTPESEEQHYHFVNLKMDGNVKMQLKDGGQLFCSHADLDYLKSKGKFRGDVDHEYVVYTESCKVNEDKRMPLVLKAREMNVSLESNENEGVKVSRSSINEITANQNVTLNYNHDFVAAADLAVYRRFGSSSNNMAGQIDLFATSQNGTCQLTNKNADLIRASKIQIDTLKRDLYFICPKGALVVATKPNQLEKLFFQSNLMTWNDQLDLLTLKEDIIIQQKKFGELHGNEEVKIYYFQQEGKKRLKAIESLGETVVAHIDQDKKLVHTLTSYGKTTVDHIHCKTTIESPRNSGAEVVDGMQIYFHDTLGEIYADKATLDYFPSHGFTEPEKLTLEGNVKILNRSSVNREESEAFLQYALADVVQFFPHTNEMVMSALNGGRVLFYDKVNNLQISAEGVKVKRDAKTKKDSVQGIGCARFNLVDHELEKLKAHFSLEPAKD